MLANQLTLVTSIFAFLVVPHVSASYFQPCEYIECYLCPEPSQHTNWPNDYQHARGKNTVMDVMHRTGFNMMTDLLERSGWGKNLTTSGPFTVFAMTDAGFDELKLKAPVWFNTLTTDMSIAALIMSNHIVSDWVHRYTVRPGKSIMSLGGPIYFDPVDDGKGTAVNGSSRIIDDLVASNGVIYVVTNQIIEDIFSMLPILPRTIGQNMTIITRALEISGVSKLIDHSTAGPYTLLAPTDKAMRALPRGALNALMENPKKLKQVLLNHMLPDALFINHHKVPVSGRLKTLGGASIPFRKTADGQVTVGVNGAKIIFPNRPGNNGVNHIIDQVIVFDEEHTNGNHH